MRRIILWIPNIITLVNLLCGSIAIDALFKEKYTIVLILVAIGLVTDFADGFVARVMNAPSSIGKDLDSLADLVTFGLLPSMILFHLAEQQEHSTWNYLCFSVGICSAVRLAKFNHDARQSYHFIGLPTPANAMMILSLLLFVVNEDPEISQHSEVLKWNVVFFSRIIYSVTYLRAFAILSSVLLVLPVRLIAFKFSKFTWDETKHQWILLAGIVFISVIFGSMALFWMMLWYLLWSIIWYYFIS